MRHYFHDATFSRFGTIPACNGQTDGRTHDDGIYYASIASRSNKSYLIHGTQHRNVAV